MSHSSRTKTRIRNTGRPSKQRAEDAGKYRDTSSPSTEHEKQPSLLTQRPQYKRTLFVGAVSLTISLLLVGIFAATQLFFPSQGATKQAEASKLPCLHIEELYRSDPGIAQICSQHLYTSINASKTVHGYQLSLDTAYADANRVMLTATLITPKTLSANAVTIEESLMTRQGVELRSAGSARKQAPGGKLYSVSFFDASSITTKARTVALHLTLHLADDVNQLQDALTFDFSIPFYQARIADVNQTVITNGVPMMLQRVVITPSETRLSVKGSTLNLDNLGKPVQPDPFLLQAQGWTSSGKVCYGKLIYQQSPFAVQGVILTLPYSLFRQQGDWLFQISANGAQNIGTWTFHFTVPLMR